ncbi:hypothetical protein F4V43_01665 [Paenibacillus spiritus]|uniref:Uncharacterized protein n=1 Tax=Paenibacillus spiritus TaxID=2496557 RepID=A0A5J5GGT1_9BACL|nr:hypothetical protein [Paenibacillus spiritus]KAA9007220.1 hypothetical protein F4V43_01665 [Paenibacillus spiritus]
MIDKLYAVCRVYRGTQYGDIHTIDSCYADRDEAEIYLREYNSNNLDDFYIDEISDSESIKSICESEGIELS